MAKAKDPATCQAWPGDRPCNLSGMAKATYRATCQAWPRPQRPCNLSGMAKATDTATCQPWLRPQRPCNFSGMAKATDTATCQVWPRPHTVQLVRHGQGHGPCNVSGMARPQTLQLRRPCNLSGKATDPATCQTRPGNRPCNLSDMARQQNLQRFSQGQGHRPRSLSGRVKATETLTAPPLGSYNLLCSSRRSSANLTVPCR